MTTYTHIVYVHPVENGLPNLAKVIEEKEFDDFVEAQDFLVSWNLWNEKEHNIKAVYRGRVNDATGELE